MDPVWATASEIAQAVKVLVKKMYLYTNNHFSAKSVVNAVMLKAQLGEPIDGEYPEALVGQYPELQALVPPGRGLDARPTSSVPLRLRGE